jgi:hypothetical protein
MEDNDGKTIVLPVYGPDRCRVLAGNSDDYP